MSGGMKPGTAAALVAAVTCMVFAAPAAATPSDRICHATASSSNPYTSQTVDWSSIWEANRPTPNGHGTHEGDIIPPSEERGYPGLNWGQGQVIWENGCEAPPRPTPTVTVTATPSPAPTVTVTATPEPAPTVTVTETPSPAPTVTVTATPTPAPTVTVTETPAPGPTVTVAPSPAPTVTVTQTPEPGPTVTLTPSPAPTVTVCPVPTSSSLADTGGQQSLLVAGIGLATVLVGAVLMWAAARRSVL